MYCSCQRYTGRGAYKHGENYSSNVQNWTFWTLLKDLLHKKRVKTGAAKYSRRWLWQEYKQNGVFDLQIILHTLDSIKSVKCNEVYFDISLYYGKRSSFHWCQLL